MDCPEQVIDYLSQFEETQLIDGFNDAIVGYAFRNDITEPIALYDWDECIDKIMKRSEMSYEFAVDYFESQILGAWVGKKTPVFGRFLVKKSC
jgi:hypothetical protein